MFTRHYFSPDAVEGSKAMHGVINGNLSTNELYSRHKILRIASEICALLGFDVAGDRRNPKKT